MTQTLTLDYDALKEAAIRLQTEGDNINDCIDKMRAVIYVLPEIWVADTCDSYVDQYLELEPKVQEMVDMITDMVAEVNRICNNLRETDSGMARQI